MAGAAPIYPDYRVSAAGVDVLGSTLNGRLPIGPVAVAAGIAGLGHHRPLEARDRLREQEAALEESGACMKGDVASWVGWGGVGVRVGPCLQVVSWRYIPRVDSEAHAGHSRLPPSHMQPQQALTVTPGDSPGPRGASVQGQPGTLGQQLGLNMCAVHWVQVSSTRLPKSLVTSCMVTWS